MSTVPDLKQPTEAFRSMIETFLATDETPEQTRHSRVVQPKLTRAKHT